MKNIAQMLDMRVDRKQGEDYYRIHNSRNIDL